MEMNLHEFRSLRILVDKDNRLAIFSMTKNPKKIEGDVWSPVWVATEDPIELQPPFTAEELADALERSIRAWGTEEPIFEDRVTLTEHRYKIKGFKKASLGTKFVGLGWRPRVGKYVSVMLPMKTKRCHMGIEHRSLPDDATWMDFAHTLIELLNIDLTQLSSYKTYKRQLNISAE